MNYSRGKLASASGVNAETIRYYETVGLMTVNRRTAGGHRIYDEAHVKRLAFIRRCRELGFSVDEIRGLLGFVDGGDYTCAEVLQRTNAHIADIKAKIRDLRNMQRTLAELAKTCSGRHVPECPIIETLWNQSSRVS